METPEQRMHTVKGFSTLWQSRQGVMARRLFYWGCAPAHPEARLRYRSPLVEPLAALAITEEQLPLRKAAELPAQALRFDAPRPANPGQAKALWDSIGRGPTLRWVTPGLSPGKRRP